MMDRQAVEYLISENKKRRERLIGDIQDCRDKIQDMEEELSELYVEWDELNDNMSK